MDDRKDSTSPVSHCAASGSESEPFAADARPPDGCQVDTYCFHGDELSRGLVMAWRIMGIDPHGPQGGSEPGNEQGPPSRRNPDDIDPQ
jgi:hypothetical protein